MSYESYYENMNGGHPDQKPPKRAGRIALLIIVVAFVFFICGILIAGLVQSAQMPWAPAIIPTPGATEQPLASAPPATPRPLPTERPMVDLDGVAPYLPDTGNPIPDIVEAVSPSVVGVVNYAKDNNGKLTEQGAGSGFFISSEGYVLTNAHVVSGADEITITLINGRELDAELIAADDFGDVAVLLVKDAQIKPLKLGDSDEIRVGEYVVTVGNPLGRDYEGTVTMGIVSARSRAVNIDSQTNTYIQTDAAINLGNSGGPLLNMKGEVIGINTAKTIKAGYDEFGTVISAEGLGFALPINKVRIIAEALITKGYVEHTALGVMIRSLTRQQIADMGLSHGVCVDSVVNGGPADAAGIKPGDVILFYDGIRAEQQTDLINYVRSQPVGTSIDMIVWRDEEEVGVTVELVDVSVLDYSDISDKAE